MKRFLIGLVVLALTVSGVASAYYRSVTRGSHSGAPVKVLIPPGAPGSAIANLLQRNHVVESAFIFRIYLKTNSIGSGLRSGEYQLREGMPFTDLVGALKKGPAVKFVRLTIPEGFNLEQISVQVQKQTHITAEQFLAAATPANVRPSILPPNATTLEGLLYPATYYVDEKMTALDLVRKMVQEFESRAADAGIDSVPGRTPYELVIIASMIEEEAKASDDRPKISAVINNRLAKGIPLGIDATIQYAVKKYHGEPLTESDLAIDSPFNSRKVAGLPPTPISSPREGSLAAAAHPAAVDYIYYVLTEDCVHHFFTKDFAEFNRARQRQPRNC